MVCGLRSVWFVDGYKAENRQRSLFIKSGSSPWIQRLNFPSPCSFRKSSLSFAGTRLGIASHALRTLPPITFLSMWIHIVRIRPTSFFFYEGIERLKENHKSRTITTATGRLLTAPSSLQHRYQSQAMWRDKLQPMMAKPMIRVGWTERTHTLKPGTIFCFVQNAFKMFLFVYKLIFFWIKFHIGSRFFAEDCDIVL